MKKIIIIAVLMVALLAPGVAAQSTSYCADDDTLYVVDEGNFSVNGNQIPYNHSELKTCDNGCYNNFNKYYPACAPSDFEIQIFGWGGFLVLFILIFFLPKKLKIHKPKYQMRGIMIMIVLSLTIGISVFYMPDWYGNLIILYYLIPIIGLVRTINVKNV